MKRLTVLLFVFLSGAGVARAADLIVEISVSTGMVDRNPIGAGASFAADIPQLVGWSRIKGATEPLDVYHRWRKDGKEEAMVKLPVRSSSYRVWSYLAPKGRKGSWALDVVDWDRKVLATAPFEIK